MEEMYGNPELNDFLEAHDEELHDDDTPVDEPLVDEPHDDETHVDEPPVVDPHDDEPHVDEEHVDEPHVDEEHDDEEHDDEPHVDEEHDDEPHVDDTHVDEPHDECCVEKTLINEPESQLVEKMVHFADEHLEREYNISESQDASMVGIDSTETIENMVKIAIEEKQLPLKDDSNDNINVENLIPKRIFQTHKSIEYVKSRPPIYTAMNSWKKFVPTFGYHFYSDYTCDLFMRNEMVQLFPNIYNAYRRLPLNVMKADLWRYSVIYKYGGIYTDTDTICKCNPTLFTRFPTQLLCAIENDAHICNWTFAAPSRSPILKQVIELCIERILSIKVIKGEHIVHFLTGPAAFTDGIEKYFVMNNIQTFNDKSKYSIYKNPTIVCLEKASFHDKFVKHLFHGDNGWKKERDMFLKY
jgi:inositol phosphorylceramide mannosyltransferase catalytic subunit